MHALSRSTAVRNEMSIVMISTTLCETYIWCPPRQDLSHQAQGINNPFAIVSPKRLSGKEVDAHTARGRTLYPTLLLIVIAPNDAADWRPSTTEIMLKLPVGVCVCGWVCVRVCMCVCVGRCVGVWVCAGDPDVTTP